MTDYSKYYRIINGEPMLSHYGLALLTGRTPEEIKQAFDENGPEYMAEWFKQGRQINKRLAAELGYYPSMEEAIQVLADRVEGRA